VSRKWHALQYEFEDVVAEVDEVELVAPVARSGSAFSRFSYRLTRAAGQGARYHEVGLEPVQITGSYDLFFAFFAFPLDISHLRALRDWRPRCGKAIAFIGEIYSQQVDEVRSHLQLLREHGFDHVYVFNPRPAAQVSRIAGCPVEFLGLGVDALRFSPYPTVPERKVDLYQFGRRSDVTHDAALELMRRDGLLYLYDTVFNVPVPDYRAHRELIAEIMKRSRYFFAYRAGEDRQRARQDDALSSRYVEGMAGGAVLLGSRPQTPEYDALFGWPDSTITIPYEAHDLGGILAELEAQPRRLAAARMHNVVETLRRHDWVYRWERILETAGLAPTSRMEQRREHLAELAAMAEEREGAVLAELA
jgi:hypothetical protein